MLYLLYIYCSLSNLNITLKRFTMTAETITTISPITNKPIVTRQGPTDAELAELPKRSLKAFESFKKTPLAERQKIVRKALDLLNEKQDELAKELTEQMGRPIAYTGIEITTAVKRGEYMLKISGDALADTPGEAQEGFNRYVRKVPLGPVLILFAWNVRLSTIGDQLSEQLIISTVPILDPDQFYRTGTLVRRYRHPEALTTDTDHCRAHVRDLPGGWRAKGCGSVFPLR